MAVKKTTITLVTDYILKVENNFAWVLDAKAPDQKIINNDNVAQVYSYATHPEIRSNYFALCNGLEFSVFRTNDTEQPVLFFQIDEIEHHWKDLKLFLSPNSFQLAKTLLTTPQTQPQKPVGFDYATRPLLEEIEVKKRAVKRHFRRSWVFYQTNLECSCRIH